MVFLTWPYLGQSVLYIFESYFLDLLATLIFVIEFEKKEEQELMLKKTHSTSHSARKLFYIIARQPKT